MHTNAIQDAFVTLCQAAAGLAPQHLLPGERQSLGGHLLSCGREVTTLVASALIHSPERYADLSIEGAALAARQAEADGWLRLRTVAGRIEKLAADHHLVAQADANQTAHAILDQIFAPPRPGERNGIGALQRQGLAHAQVVRRTYQRHIHKAHKIAAVKRPRSTPLKREQARALVYRAFATHLRQKRPLPATAPEKSAIAPLDVPGAVPKTDPMPPTLHKPNLQDRFLSHLTGTPPGGPPLVPHLSTTDLLSMQGQAAELCARSQTPRFSDEIRADLSGKRSPILPELLLLCGRGLSARPTFAQQIAVDEDACRAAAAQDGALSRLIKASGDVHGCAAEAAAQTATRAEQGGEQTLAAAATFVADPKEDRSRRIAVEDSFAEAFRLHEDGAARSERRLERKERRLRPLRQALAEAETGAAELRLIDRFLAHSDK